MGFFCDMVKAAVDVALLPITIPLEVIDLLESKEPSIRFITYEGDYPKDQTPSEEQE